MKNDLVRIVGFKLLILVALASKSVVAAPSNYAATRYPIAAATGFTGATKMLGVVDYWYGVERALSRSGNDWFYVPLISAAAGEDIRVTQFEKAVEAILMETNTDKVHLLGHSQGGFTVRAYAALHPDKVASLTTIGTPHRGADAAMLIWELNLVLEDYAPWIRDSLLWVVNSVMWANGKLNGEDLEQDSYGALYLLTPQGAIDFANQVSGFGFNPDCNEQAETRATGVINNGQGNTLNYDFPIFSWTGRGSPTSLFASGENLFDPLAYSFSLSHKALKWFSGEENDGVVSVCSAAFGKVLANNYRWDHFDEVNHLFGLTSGPDPRTVIVNHMNRLKNLGL